MTNQEFISTLNSVENTSKHYELISHIIESEPNRLLEIQKLIPKDDEYLLKNWQTRSVYERIIKVASFELGLEHISITYKIFNECFREKDKNLMASILCCKHNSILLVNSLTSSNCNRLLQLVIHELVSRGIDLNEADNFEKLEQVNSYSEFSRLSLKASELEKSNDFPSYTVNGGGNGINFGFQQNETYQPCEQSFESGITFKEAPKIKFAIEHWGEASLAYRGNFLEFADIKGIICSVPELLESKKIRIRELEPSKAYSMIFNASSNGTAYTTGYFGAHGRLRTWGTINSMSSENEFESVEKTEQNLVDYKWFEFNTDSWFINEWLDLGILCINEESKEFGIIASTDTD